MPRDAEDPADERQYHLELSRGEVAETVLLPGDPERVPLIASTWDDHELLAEHREYVTAAGSIHGTPVSATSTGIGSPSAAIAVEELARVGAETFVRVGSCGAIQPGIDVGELVITTGAVRLEGTSDEYVQPAYPAVASHEVVGALVAAAERLGHDYHLGLTASTDAFYAGQGRPGVDGFRAPGAEERLEALQEAGVANVEMEASAILTLAAIYGRRAGAICAVYANRTTGDFAVEGQRRAAETASLATHLLDGMDERRDAEGASAFHPGLSIEYPED